MAAAPITTDAVHRARVSFLRQWDAWLDTPLLVLGAAWLILLVIELTYGLSPGLELAGTLIWIVFLGDFMVRLGFAPKKLEYLRRNWLSGLALLLPALRLLRLGRVWRVARLARASRSLRLAKVLGSLNRGLRALRRTLRRRGFSYVVLSTILVNILGAAGMYAFERSIAGAAGLPDYTTALWWTAMLLTTVGSDYWPHTPEGRLLCLLLSVYAVAIFGYLAALLASFFIGRDAAEERTATSLRAVQQELARLRRQLGET